MRIDNNVGMWAIRYLQTLQRTGQEQVRALAQGTIPLAQNVSAAAIAERMRAQISGYREAMQSTYYAIGMMNVAEGGLRAISNSLQRMRELAVAASNATLTEAERQSLQQEFTKLAEGINRTVEHTRYNSIRVLGGEVRNLRIQTGPNEGQQMMVSLPSMDVRNLGLENANLSSVENAQNALKALEQAIETVSNTRGYVGATTNRLASAARELSNTVLNLTSSVSILVDTDMARGVMDWVRTQLMTRATAGVLSQSNVSNWNALRLLG